MEDSLSNAFLGRLGPDAAEVASLQPRPLGPFLAELAHRAHAAWPAVTLDPQRYVEHLAVVAARQEPGHRRLDSLSTDDLYLAGACVEGDAEAVRVLHAMVGSETDVSMARQKLPREMGDEIKQMLRKQLLVEGPDGRPYITAYNGRGRLVGWIRVIAVRQALKMIRDQRTRPLDDRDLDALARQPELQGGGSEQELMKALYQSEVRAAFRQAVGCLTERERTVLARTFIDGWTIDGVGEELGVHRATAARWIERAKQSLVGHVRRVLMEQLHIDAETYASILRLVRSRLDLSVRYLMVER